MDCEELPMSVWSGRALGPCRGRLLGVTAGRDVRTAASWKQLPKGTNQRRQEFEGRERSQEALAGSVVGKTTEFCQPVRQNWLCPVLGRTHAKGGWQNLVQLQDIQDSWRYDLLTGLESISPDDIAAEFAALEELKRTEEVQSINEVEVLVGNAFDFDELDPVGSG
ncbi:hypothetical protein DFJ58DRAFT_916056 [Suillus subalutaceus]|uniref:uncharacterized protein n=1 Tax=Suillus subalutaceus TaxID=48586 RepID=UPI001B86277B|nr:uncharacterized protein DFJ58DRAFT_916056 [Suillus subalutaceus]KAG1842980.1 hypothetical protein DFJ58DRAFT_916056 [Suillus subalutaceus]